MNIINKIIYLTLKHMLYLKQSLLGDFKYFKHSKYL